MSDTGRPDIMQVLNALFDGQYPQRGTGNRQGPFPCPNKHHADSEPSFHVYLDQQVGWCFGGCVSHKVDSWDLIAMSQWGHYPLFSVRGDLFKKVRQYWMNSTGFETVKPVKLSPKASDDLTPEFVQEEAVHILKLWQSQADDRFYQLLEREHGINKETAIRFGIGFTGDTKDTEYKHRNRLAIPWWDSRHKILVGIKTRQLLRDCPKQYKYGNLDGGRTGSGLFNCEVIRNGDHKEALVITEDEWSVFHLHQGGFQAVSKPAAKGVRAGGLNLNWEDAVHRFEVVVIIGDNDDTGRASAQARADWIGQKAILVFPPAEYNDYAEWSTADPEEAKSTVVLAIKAARATLKES